MAEEIAELVVKIKGDASDLETAISGVTKELMSVEKSGASAGKGLASYEKQLKQAETAMQSSRTSLAGAKKAYENNLSAMEKNSAELRKQKSGLENLITAKNNEIKALEKANTVVNKGSDAYRDNQKAIQWTKTELTALQSEHKSVASALKTQESELKKSKQAYNEASAAVEKATKKYSEYEKGLKSVQKAEKAKNLQKTGKNMKELGSSIDTITKPMQNMALVTAAGGVAAAKFAIDFEDNFANVRKTVDGTDEELENIKKSIIDLSTSTGVGTDELTELAAIAGQLGIKTENISGFTETMAKLGTATNLAGEGGAQTLARFMNVANVSQDNIDRLGSSIVDLGNHFATTEAEIADMAMDMGATGATVGMSAQDILGYATALSSMGIEAAAGGSALQRIWMEMQNAVSKGGKSLNAFAKTSGKSSKEFQKAWKKDATGAFNDFLKGLNQSGDKVGLLSQLGFENVRDQRALLALAGEKGFGVLTEAIERSNKAWDENNALNEEFAKKQETTARQMAIAKQNIIEAGRSLGETFLPIIADASKGVANFAQKLANLSDGGKKAVIGIGATVIGLGALAKTGAGTIKTIGGVLEAVGKIKSFIAGTGGSAVGTAAASGTGEAAVSAGTAAAGIGGFSAGLGSATAASAAALAPLAVLEAAFGAVYVGAIAASKGIEENRKKLREHADASQAAADKVAEVNANIEQSAPNNEALKDKVNEWLKLQGEIAEGGAGASDAQERIKGVETWIIEHYGDYITAEEKKNGIRRDSIQLLYDLADAQDKANEKEKKEAQDKARKALEQGKKDAPKNIKEISQAQARISQFTKEKEEANRLSDELGVLQKKYEAINNAMPLEERGKTIAQLREDNGKLFADFQMLTGSPLNMDDFGSAFNNLSNKAQEATDKIAKNSETVTECRENMMKHASDAKTVVEANAGQTFGEAAIKLKTLKAAVEEYNKKGKLSDSTALALRRELPDVEKGLAAAGDKAIYLKNALTMEENKRLGLEEMRKELEETLRALGALPEGKTIKVNDDGSIEEVKMNAEECAARLTSLHSKKYEVKLNANGKPFAVIMDGIEKTLEDFNSATGTATVTAQDGTKYVIDTATGRIIGFNNVYGEARITAKNETEQGVAAAKETLKDVKDKEVKIKATLDDSGLQSGWQKLQQTGALFNVGKGFARGKPASDNYEGPAIVNDGTGPEAIEDKSGNIRVPVGRNVLTYVNRNDKVYTAEQTRRMFAVPHFADGKDNSAGFTDAKESWSSYTKTHAVTTTQELEKWVELSKKFRDNEKDVADIQAQIFSLMQKQNKELNDRSKKYLEEHTALNDWGDAGDDPMAAFERVRQRNIAEAEAGRQTWEEANDAMSSVGSKMYDDRISMSQKWLDHEEKYNNLSADDYIAGIDRMKAYTQQYYDAGMISYREYIEGMSELSDKFFDKQKEQQEELKKQRQELLSSQLEGSKAYTDERNYFNDWNDVGDDPLSAYNRVREREWQAVVNGDRTEDEFNKTMSSFGLEMYSGRRDTSTRWLDEQRKYFGMTDEEYVQGLERIKAYTQEYYDNGLISRREYNEAMTDLNHQMWDEAESAYEKALSDQQKYISDTREILSKQEQELQESWTVADRAEDMSDVQRQLDIYAGAVTDRGQQKYAELQEQMKKLQREEELYQLQIANNATIERLEADYAQMEDMKADFLKNIVTNTNIDVSGIVGDITSKISGTGNDITHTLSDIIDAIHGIKMEQQNFNDSRQINITTSDAAVLSKFMGGV